MFTLPRFPLKQQIITNQAAFAALGRRELFFCAVAWNASEASTHASLPTPDTGDKKFNSHLVAPTIHNRGMFRKFVERLSLFQLKSYVAEDAVQRDRFQDFPFLDHL